MVEAVPQRLLDNVLPDRAALDEALVGRERELAVETARAEAAERLAAQRLGQLQAVEDSLTWRLGSRLVRVPGLRAAARALAGRAAPGTAVPRDPDPRREPK